MAELSGNIEVPLGRQGSGLAQVLDNDKSIHYLQQARQRQDQINHYAALEKLKRDEMEAARKKAEADNMVSAKWETDNGLDFATGVKELADADIQATKKILANPNTPKHIKDQAVNDSTFRISSRNNWAKTQKEAFDAVEKNAKYYNIDPVKRIEYVKGAMTSSPDFYKRGDHAIGYESIVKDPYNFNAKEAGVDLLKGEGKTTVKVTNPDGSESSTTWDNILNQPKLVGQKRVVAEINQKEAARLIGSNPQVTDWYNRFVERKQKDILKDDPTMPPAKATEEALKMGTDMLFSGLATINYDADKTTIKGKARQSAQGTDESKTKEVVRTLDLNYVPKTPPAVQPSWNQGLPTGATPPPLGPKRVRFIDAIGRQFEKPITIGPGVNAILLSGEDAKTPDYLTKQDDGTYRTKFGFKAPNMTEIPNAKYTVGPISTTKKVYEAGEVLDPDEVQDIMKAGKGDLIKTGRVGRFSPTTMQIDEMDGKLVNPSLQNIDILIPMEDIPVADVFSKDKGVPTRTTRFKSLSK